MREGHLPWLTWCLIAPYGNRLMYVVDVEVILRKAWTKITAGWLHKKLISWNDHGPWTLTPPPSTRQLLNPAPTILDTWLVPLLIASIATVDITYINYRLRVIMGRVAIPHDRCRLLGYRPTCDFRFSYTWPKYFTSYRRSLYLEWPEVLHEVPTGTNIHSEVRGDAWPHCWKSCDLVWCSVITEESRLVARRASVITEEGMLLPRFEVFLIPTTSKG